ncbi:MAG TPA: YceI family protein [Caulobacterales bacterium]|jgi:polyisoprenoid-binding protein YceI|nr:YceI family protein [Caulobacterales bacterium]
MRRLILLGALCAASACAPPAPPAPPAADNTNAVHASAAPLLPDVPAGEYKLDKAHASLTFRLSHMGFSNYTAQFKSFDAHLMLDPKNPAAASVTAAVDPRSLDLSGPPKGFLDDLRGPNWLDVKQFPEIKFVSKAIAMTAPDAARITGDLTLHGVTKPITLDAKFNGGYAGNIYDPNARIGFSATGVFKRSDFGIAYGIPAPGTNMGVFDDVSVAIESEFSGPPWKEAPSASPQ